MACQKGINLFLREKGKIWGKAGKLKYEEGDNLLHNRKLHKFPHLLSPHSLHTQPCELLLSLLPAKLRELSSFKSDLFAGISPEKMDKFASPSKTIFIYT